MTLSNHRDNEIKEIPDVPKLIFEAAKSGRLVLFIGAGVSRIIGYPSWNEFALLQLKDLYEKRAINYYEYTNLKSLDARKLLSICKRIYEEKNIIPQRLKSLIKGKNELIEKYKIYDDLYSFNAIYVTTNYDDYLDNVAQKASLRKPPFISEVSPADIIEGDTQKSKIIDSKEQLLISHLTNGAIIHLHGSINTEDSIIVTIVDYMKHYERDSKPAVFLEEIFNYTVLFIGYGLEEYEILEFMISKSHTAKGELKHFMLYPIFKKETNLLDFQKKYYADLGIQLVPYHIDESGYEYLATVIHEWAKQIGQISRPQGFLERIKLIDEVI